MKSKAMFDLDKLNNPIIRLEISKDSDDLRDKVAARFTEALGHTSHHCNIKFLSEHPQTNPIPGFPDDRQVWEISPVTHQQYLKEFSYGVIELEVKDEKTHGRFSFGNMSEDTLEGYIKWVKLNPGPYRASMKRKN